MRYFSTSNPKSCPVASHHISSKSLKRLFMEIHRRHPSTLLRTLIFLLHFFYIFQRVLQKLTDQISSHNFIVEIYFASRSSENENFVFQTEQVEVQTETDGESSLWLSKYIALCNNVLLVQFDLKNGKLQLPMNFPVENFLEGKSARFQFSRAFIVWEVNVVSLVRFAFAEHNLYQIYIGLFVAVNQYHD